jgi:hypothetical protein
MQVDAGLLPLPLRRALGDAAHGGDFSKREPAEKLEIDQLRKRRVGLASSSSASLTSVSSRACGNVLDESVRAEVISNRPPRSARGRRGRGR